jgi:glycosyltransferase involved in cell wall biosynthesis
VHVIAPEHSGGGAESVIAALAAAQPATTHVVALNQLAAESDPAHPFPMRLRERGIHASEIRSGRRQYAAEARALAELIARERADVVHSHGYHGDVVAWLATRRGAGARVATVHGYIRRNFKEHAFNVVDRTVLRRFDAVIAVSAPLRAELVSSGIAAKRVHLVENGLAPAGARVERTEARARLGVPHDARVCGWIGRLSPEKGPDLFVEALLATPDVLGVLIGDGPERAALEQRVRDAGAAARIHHAGFRADAAALLPAFDALALTSRTEGTPMVILEAVAAGVPVVAFAVGGVPALLDDSVAWVVDSGDVAAIARAIEEATSSPAEGALRAERARARLNDRLSTERWVERTNAVYEEACARRATRR